MATKEKSISTTSNVVGENNSGETNLTSPLNKNNYKVQKPSEQNKFTSAEAGMASSIVGSATSAATDLYAGYLNNKQTEAANKEARDLAYLNREDILKQQAFDYSLNKKRIALEEKNLATKKMIDRYNLMFDKWQREITNAIEARNNLVSNAQKIADGLKSSEVQAALNSTFGGA